METVTELEMNNMREAVYDMRDKQRLLIRNMVSTQQEMQETVLKQMAVLVDVTEKMTARMEKLEGYQSRILQEIQELKETAIKKRDSIKYGTMDYTHVGRVKIREMVKSEECERTVKTVDNDIIDNRSQITMETRSKRIRHVQESRMCFRCQTLGHVMRNCKAVLHSNGKQKRPRQNTEVQTDISIKEEKRQVDVQPERMKIRQVKAEDTKEETVGKSSAEEETESAGNEIKKKDCLLAREGWLWILVHLAMDIVRYWKEWTVGKWSEDMTEGVNNVKTNEDEQSSQVYVEKLESKSGKRVERERLKGVNRDRQENMRKAWGRRW